MSTRATYCFKAHRWNPQVTFYIHHDGYPDGAAQYFHEAIKYYPEATERYGRAQRFAMRFLRANTRAELTESHDVHGDTEYRYTYDESTMMLLVEKIVWGDSTKTDTWEIISNTGIDEFLKEHLHDIKPEDCPMELHGQLITPRIAYKMVQSKVCDLFLDGDNPNKESFLKFTEEVRQSISFATGRSPFSLDY